jgi:hypothetical protein
MAEDGDAIPRPGGIRQYLDDEDYVDAVCWAMIEVDTSTEVATS